MSDERINEDELDFDDDQRLLNGAPFNGIAYLQHPNGQIKRVAEFKDGFREGLCQEWFANGQIRTEWFAVRGRAKGKVTQWYEAGSVRSVGEYEHGVEVAYDEWNEDGELKIHREIQPRTELYRYLQEMRKTEGAT
jgi:antitoxin component YwqK of YwqJK toxin-antitoxin module